MNTSLLSLKTIGGAIAAVVLSCVLCQNALSVNPEKVPNLVGMPLAKAIASAGSQKLTCQVAPDPRPTTDPKMDGLVASQYPNAGMIVPPSRSISLIPFKYSPAVKESVVPNVVGLPLDQATAALTQLGFQVHVFQTQFVFDPAKNNIIFGQDKAPGTKLARGQYVVLSKYEYHAKSNAPVPNVVGMTVAEAKNALKKAEFTIVNVAGFDDARVTSQRPAAGQAYSTYNVVLLYTSVARTQTVPQVIDMPIANAALKVAGAGLHPVMEAVASHSRGSGPPRLGGGPPPVRYGIVLEQRPAPGETLAKDEAVYLVYIPTPK
jgi:beta-lactam-binding protein with PASTA domain